MQGRTSLEEPWLPEPRDWSVEKCVWREWREEEVEVRLFSSLVRASGGAISKKRRGASTVRALPWLLQLSLFRAFRT